MDSGPKSTPPHPSFKPRTSRAQNFAAQTPGCAARISEQTQVSGQTQVAAKREFRVKQREKQ
jgi:hypothetical protein